MPDWIALAKKVHRRLASRAPFAFRSNPFKEDGVTPEPIFELQRRLGMTVGTRWFSRAYQGVPGRVHLHDSMMFADSPDRVAHYIGVGRSGLENVQASLDLAGRTFGDIESCLDMACGYGRVLRWLAQRIPPDRITACDLVAEAVRFLHEEFGVGTLASAKNPCLTVFPQSYDLIWVGSLFTHLNEETSRKFLEMLYLHLRPRGVLVFTAHGPSCLDHVHIYGDMFVDKAGEFRRQLDLTGLAYLPYFDHDPDYGITFTLPSWVEKVFKDTFGDEAKLIRYAERGWDRHQDVYAYQRCTPSA